MNVVYRVDYKRVDNLCFIIYKLYRKNLINSE